MSSKMSQKVTDQIHRFIKDQGFDVMGDVPFLAFIKASRSRI